MNRTDQNPDEMLDAIIGDDPGGRAGCARHRRSRPAGVGANRGGGRRAPLRSDHELRRVSKRCCPNTKRTL